MQVHPKDAPHSTDRVVQVTGNLLEVIDATKLVYEAVADAEVEVKISQFQFNCSFIEVVEKLRQTTARRTLDY